MRDFLMEAPKKVFVFLDLEETCIDEWSTRRLLSENLQKINWFLNGKDVVIPMKGGDIIDPATPILNLHVGLMSWAVWNQRDLEVFNNFRGEIEEAIGCKFDDELLYTMDDWSRLIFAATGKKLSRDDLFDLFGKPEVLFSLVRKQEAFYNSNVYLIDDAYEHLMEFRSPMNACVGQILNINKL